jgi:hypothetical protein
VLSKPLSAAATQEFHIEGTWADPKIAKVPRSLQLLPQGIPSMPGLSGARTKARNRRPRNESRSHPDGVRHRPRSQPRTRA